MLSTKTLVLLAAMLGAEGLAGAAFADQFIEGNMDASAAVLLVSLTVTISLLGTCFGFIKWVLRNQGIYEPLTKLLTDQLQKDTDVHQVVRTLSTEVAELREIVRVLAGETAARRTAEAPCGPDRKS